jgi:hypothetical protein
MTADFAGRVEQLQAISQYRQWLTAQIKLHPFDEGFKYFKTMPKKTTYFLGLYLAFFSSSA